MPEPKRDSEYWFKDGNIVLLSEDRTAAYRVHSTLLCRKSTVFTDLLDIPQPQYQETMDECPVVTLGDSAHDISVLLGLLYNGWEYVVVWLYHHILFC